MKQLKAVTKAVLVNCSVLTLLLGAAGLVLNKKEYGYYWSLKDFDPQATRRHDFRTKKDQSRQFIDDNQALCYQLHPYIGYANACAMKGSIGLTKEYRPQEFNTDKALRVLVLGGSVASHLSVRTSLEDRLNSLLINKPIKTSRGFVSRALVFNAALGGFKQPQQLFTYQLLDTLGFKPDIIINVSGVNEVGLPFSENYKQGIQLYLPRSQALKEVAESEYLDNGHSIHSRSVGYFPIKLIALHPFAQYLIRRYPDILLPYGHWRDRLTKEKTKGSVYALQEKMSDRQVFINSLKIWGKSSQNIATLAKFNAAKYFEYLQPNQYVRGSKMINPTEVKQALSNNHPYGMQISKFYSEVSSSSLGLPEKLVWDARMIFKSNSQHLYTDSCCHLNAKGMALIADDIAIRIIRAYQ